ncbi:hypothetical protein AB0C96_27075 [Streptomyces sp. NPDC048506]|uniref:hypothetical protein n=1 Tax=Streptomyces sp. NPDC048506 TaxID=3155028 RepID=UPI00341AF1B8
MNNTSILAACLRRLSWSPDRLAREINRVCGAGTISAKAPYNWLKGSCPRHGLPRVVSEILAERLGEPVPLHSLWPDKFPPTEPDSGPDRLPGTPPEPCHSVCRVPPAQRCLSPSTTATGQQGLAIAAVDWLLNTDTPPRGQRGVEGVDAAVLSLIGERISQFRLLDDDRGGRLLLDWAVQDLRWAMSLVDTCSYDQETGIRLHRLVAELAHIVGWVAADLGDEAHGRHYLLQALRSARLAGDRALAAHVLSCLSYLAMWHGRGEEALRLIRIARKGTAGQAPSPGQALLVSRQARAHASLGDRDGCARALEETAAIYEAMGDEQGMTEPRGQEPWAYWVTRAVLVGDAGRAWLEVGRPGRAAFELARGLELFDGSQPRNRLLHQTSLAEARLLLGELDGAAQAAGAALDLAGQVASARGRTRLTGLRRQLQRHDAADVRRIVQRTDDVLGCTRL